MDPRPWIQGLGSRGAPVASGGRLASQKSRRVGARSSPRPDGVWGEKNAPVVSHHGYVRARRTSPGRSLCKGCLLGNCLDGGGAGTKAHTVSIRVAGAKVVGGPAWRVLGVGSRGPHVRVCSHGSHPSWAVACQLTCRFERTRWLLPSVDPRFRWIIKPVL